MLSDDAPTVAKKVRGMFTDPKRIHADIPGTVEGNPVFEFHDVFNPNQDEVTELKQRYRTGKVGDGEVKDRLIEALEGYLGPMRQRMASYETQPGLIDEILMAGTQRMRGIARDTMNDVRRAMGLQRALNRIRRSTENRIKKQAKQVAKALQSEGWATERLRALLTGPDLVAQRETVLRFIVIRPTPTLSDVAQNELTRSALQWLKAAGKSDWAQVHFDLVTVSTDGSLKWTESALDSACQARLNEAVQ